MTAYLLSYTGYLENLEVRTYADRISADRAWEKLPQSGYVLETDADVKLIGGKLLVDVFNKLGPEGSTPVKKFETTAIGQARLLARVVELYRNQPHSAAPPPATEPETNPAEDDANAAPPTIVGAGAQPEEEQDDMAKAKAKKTPKTSKLRAKAALTIDLPQNLSPPAGTTCGCYIRSLVMDGKTTERVLELVAKHYPDNTTKASDVSWNKGKLKAAGKKVPVLEKAAKKA